MHLGVIPDGNRRYASNKGIKNREAYSQAKDVIKQIGKELRKSDYDLEEATFYLLSEENLKRDEDELETLFELLEKNLEDIGSSFHDLGFSFNWASTKPEAVSMDVRRKLQNLEEKFEDGDRVLNLLISYSGKKDILQASRKVSENGGKFSKESIKNHLEIDSDIDYVIRTGENPERECISGFPIWNSSYAEFYHVKKNFPAVEYEDIDEALIHLQNLRRKKGE